MFKALIYGAVAALVGSKLKKMNDEGRLEPYKEQARKGAQQLRERVSEQVNAIKKSSAARSSTPAKAAHAAPYDSASDISKPAKPYPFPVDPKAMPSSH